MSLFFSDAYALTFQLATMQIVGKLLINKHM
jgi:hypothetical protein